MKKKKERGPALDAGPEDRHHEHQDTHQDTGALAAGPEHQDAGAQAVEAQDTGPEHQHHEDAGPEELQDTGGPLTGAIPAELPAKIPGRLWTKAEAAEYLGIEVRTLEGWILQRRVPFVRIGKPGPGRSNLIRFIPARLAAWVESHSVEPTAEPEGAEQA